MKIIEENYVPGFRDIRIIKFAKFQDHRGYFTESYNKEQFNRELKLFNFKGLYVEVDGNKKHFSPFVQHNESFSHENVVRGLHFQWAPYMGKLVRTVQGRMVDIFLDIRIGSDTFGKVGMYEMKSSKEHSEWIWVPPGFAHGNFFSEATTIEYLCTGMYSKDTEAGISPLSDDLDWSLCDEDLKLEYSNLILNDKAILSVKDKDAMFLGDWKIDSRAYNFTY